jgi:hypothetical protein
VHLPHGLPRYTFVTITHMWACACMLLVTYLLTKREEREDSKLRRLYVSCTCACGRFVCVHPYASHCIKTVCAAFTPRVGPATCLPEPLCYSEPDLSWMINKIHMEVGYCLCHYTHKHTHIYTHTHTVWICWPTTSQHCCTCALVRVWLSQSYAGRAGSDNWGEAKMTPAVSH